MAGAARPKSGVVHWLLLHFSEQLEYDCLALGVDVLDWHRGELSTRRLGVLFENLPASSATKSAIVAEHNNAAPDAMREWGVSERLLATVIDAIQINTHALLQVNSKKKLKPPPPMETPGSAARPKPRQVSLAEFRSITEG